MRQGLYISQSMRLTQTLTPQMRMNLELIQAPILEAVQNMEQQVMSNPWLERNEELTDPRFIRDADQTQTVQHTPKQEVDIQDGEAWFNPVAATPWTHEEFPADETTGAIAVATPSPYEQLETQTRELDIAHPVADLVIRILQGLDGSGFLAPPKNEEELLLQGLKPVEKWLEILKVDPDAWLIEVLGLRTEERELLDEALYILRYHLEPPGVGARNQSHCYLIQLERQGKGDSLAAQLIRDGELSNIKPRNLDSVAKKLGVSGTELRKALEVLHKLHGKPFALIDHTVEPTRYPDLIAEKVDDDWIVSLSHPLSGRYRYRENRIPRKKALEEEAAREGGDGEDPAKILMRLREMRSNARMLVRATEYRDRTLYEIGMELVRQQTEFLERGEEALKPLLQKELAERLGLNEATVSRILKEKHMLTPRGLIPLSAFFSRAVVNKKGEKIANKAIMDALVKLLSEEEDPQNPWSDKEISLILKQRGLPISRRTVTKYRGIMEIGAAGDRKAQNKIQDAR